MRHTGKTAAQLPPVCTLAACSVPHLVHAMAITELIKACEHVVQQHDHLVSGQLGGHLGELHHVTEQDGHLQECMVGCSAHG